MSKKVALIYGSSVGNTRFVAEKIHERFPEADLIPAETADIESLGLYDFLILGTSTWGVGQLQDDFETFVEKFVELDLSDKTLALFGLGDQQTYPDTFCDGMGKLFENVENKQARFVGQWPADDYDFSESRAVREGMFVGLALDEDNEPDLTDNRIDAWSKQVRQEAGLSN